MLKKSFSLIFLLLGISLIGHASPFPSGTQKKQLLMVCNSEAGNSESCSNYSINKLKQITSLYTFDPADHMECGRDHDNGPDDDFCNQPASGVNATFLIVDAVTGNVNKTLIKARPRFGQINYQSFSLSTTPEERVLGENARLAEIEYKQLSNNFKLTQHSNGSVYNANGVIVDSINSDVVGNFANCHTATSYSSFYQPDDSFASCTGFINGIIDRTAAESHRNQSAGVSFTDWLRSWEADSANLGTISFKIPNYKKFTYVLSFDDNSKLAINVDIDNNGNALLTLNEDLSRTSENLTFKQYKESLNNRNGTTHNKDEVLSYLDTIGAKDSCFARLVTLGYRQRLKSRVTERWPDGSPKRVEITLISQTPVHDRVIVCNSSPIGR